MISTDILKTLSYFSLFNFPLTKEELFFYITPKDFNYEDFLKELQFLADQGKVDTQFGYYFFPGESSFIDDRNKAVVHVEKKLKIARRAARLICCVPFIKAVYVCNSVAAEVPKENSDIDLFIITTKKRIWIVRFFTNLILLMARMRTRKNRSANSICLSFFVDEENLNMNKLKVAEDDVYLKYWLLQLLPLYDPENFKSKLLEENFGGHFSIDNFAPITNSALGRTWKRMWEKFWEGKYGDLIENQVHKIQIDIIRRRYKNIPISSPSIMITDGVLKFHENDARMRLRDAWANKCSNLC